MNSGGPPTSSLTERLRLKTETERQSIEALTLSELQTLAKNLSAASSAALYSMQSATHGQMTEFEKQMSQRLGSIAIRIGQTEAAQRRWPLWSAAGALALSGSILIGLWGLSAWQSEALLSLQTQSEQERQTLDLLKQQTGGVKYTTTSSGLFLVLPKGVEPGWTCDGLKCIKLGK